MASEKLARALRNELTFVGKDGAIMIRLVDDAFNGIRAAAKTLNARYVIAAFDWDNDAKLPIWSVYDMSKGWTYVPSGGLALPLPERTFSAETNDGAVMFAMALIGGGN